ncbi:MAG: efflux RND transporter permease subunit [Gemmatimonadetes bacterium]|nr:efflux RND transporter permease subunit [Gemmatimonadota bacterium]
MILSDLSIRRPVLATMLSLALVLFGVIGYRQLTIREYPDVDPPIVSVSVFLRGANPRVMESAVTDVLEEELSAAEGLRTMTSVSSEQSANVTLEFNLDRDVEVAAQDVRDLVSRVRRRLPEEVEEPVVSKQDADARPFMFISLTGDNYNLLQLTEIADRYVKTPLQTVAGIGRADIRGERRYAMRVWLKAPELASRGLTTTEVISAIRSRNVEIPAGRIESNQREFTVRSLGELKTPEEFSGLVVANMDGQLVKLGDVARVELGPEDDRSRFRFNRQQAIGVSLTRQSKANLVEVADAIHALVPKLQVPPGIELTIGYDNSIYVKRSIKEAQETLVLAGGLVILIIFVFLRNLRATIIPGLAIPTSIIATFAVMYFLDFSINNLTLLALILAIGIVVDDAIIVLENAYRRQEELHEDPETAAINGTREIAFAVIATTISLVAVFVPLAFLKGSTGRLFNEFGISVAAAVAISGFVALTLTPMLCAKILRVPERHGALFGFLERGFDGLTGGYQFLLAATLRHRGMAMAGTGAMLVLAWFTFKALKTEFVPPEDRGMIMVNVVAPEGASIGYTDEYQKQVEKILSDVPEIYTMNSMVAFGGGGGGGGRVNTGMLFIRMIDWSDRERSVQDVLAELQPKLSAVPGVLAFGSNPPAFGGFGQPVQFVVRHPDFDSLVTSMDTLIRRARQIKGLINIDTDLRVNKPELTVRYERDRMEDLGVPVRDVATTMQTLLGGQRVSTFTRDNELYDVVVQLDPAARATPSDMSDLTVKGRGGQLIKLDQLARVTENVGPRQLNHFNRIRAATLNASLAPGFTLGEAVDSLRALATEVLPAGATVALSGESRELEESGGALYFAFVLALIVVFMVLAAQFESIVHPFTVLLAVPPAVTGAVFTLFIAKSTINLYSQIGMILLIGLVTKNSILLVEYANQLKERGQDTLSALLEAGRIRLRPILMTSVATVVGAVPIALGLGAGSSSRRPLGYAIVGGVILSTAMTLFLVPVVYSLLDQVLGRVRKPKVAESAVAMTGDAP